MAYLGGLGTIKLRGMLAARTSAPRPGCCRRAVRPSSVIVVVLLLAVVVTVVFLHESGRGSSELSDVHDAPPRSVGRDNSSLWSDVGISLTFSLISGHITWLRRLASAAAVARRAAGWSAAVIIDNARASPRRCGIACGSHRQQDGSRRPSSSGRTPPHGWLPLVYLPIQCYLYRGAGGCARRSSLFAAAKRSRTRIHHCWRWR